MKFLEKLQQLDETILIQTQKLRTPFLTPILMLLTHSGTGRSWFIFALVLNAFHYAGFHFAIQQTTFVRALFCPLLAWLLSKLVKRIFSRARPSEKIAGYQPMLVTMPTCGSFPSAHAAAAVAFFTGLLLFGHPLSLIVGVWALGVSFSRLYLGVHYLSDILAGAGLGAISAFILTY